MVTTTVAPTTTSAPVLNFSITDLSERGIFSGSRVGSCRERGNFGTILAVVDENNVLVAFDSGQNEWVSWVAVSPFGYTVAL